MSIELRFERDSAGTRWLTCDLGRIEHSQPLPARNQIGRLMLTIRDYAEELARDGPKLHWDCAVHSVTRHGDILAAHIDYNGRRWTWELLPAHWWDDQGPPVYLGRWTQ